MHAKTYTTNADRRPLEDKVQQQTRLEVPNSSRFLERLASFFFRSLFEHTLQHHTHRLTVLSNDQTGRIALHFARRMTASYHLNKQGQPATTLSAQVDEFY
mmetsp:Transcript_28075/g.36715  ORF Transcript_28075/g.36715 Transcript_28075/m.36715 type:complete len:101 (-) Transcript_28075:251-553(-)